MTPYYDTGQTAVYLGDVRDVLRSLPAESVNCVVTSPPYWSLRDYGIEPSVWGERPGLYQCPVNVSHEWSAARLAADAYGSKAKWQHEGISRAETPEAWSKEQVSQGQTCQRCGAWSGQLGLEPTHTLFVDHMVEVFREVRRVLKPDGTAWVNLGDSYANSTTTTGRNDATRQGKPTGGNFEAGPKTHIGALPPGLKPKDLVGIPWRVAFALQDDGWWLRQDIIWSKPNPMPESVTDRCTKAHEYIFLLAKSARYYYDADAVREDAAWERWGDQTVPKYEGTDTATGWMPNGAKGVLTTRTSRNKRSVWTVATSPYADAHFATFPPDLVKPCILAGCPEGGTVLDPFFGSGTTGMVANALGRKAIGIDLNPEYLEMARKRVSQLGMAMEVTD